MQHHLQQQMSRYLEYSMTSVVEYQVWVYKIWIIYCLLYKGFFSNLKVF